MKDDDVHVLAEPGAKRAVPKGLKLPADLRFPGPSPLASPRLLQDAAAGPQSVRSADREIVANDFEDDDSDGVVIDVENQNADRTEASDSTVMETNLNPCRWVPCFGSYASHAYLPCPRRSYWHWKQCCRKRRKGKSETSSSFGSCGVQTLDKSRRYKASRTKDEGGIFAVPSFGIANSLLCDSQLISHIGILE
ncbi:hypothetical protein EUGRSUZ_K01938 [Eucalyptus grandis]|uniref:Uncharacterized protein n=2 Tax=Eucalyptus grandis TaxID=71139 RepID=A0ACC3KWQ3_EUCGR|nr:hypothetical protein EUGRSUZ_K01938 [Eucalyptus grandis]